jgi:hypothetical protein
VIDDSVRRRPQRADAARSSHDDASDGGNDARDGGHVDGVDAASVDEDEQQQRDDDEEETIVRGDEVRPQDAKRSDAWNGIFSRQPRAAGSLRDRRSGG